MRLDRYLTLCDLGTRKQVRELITQGRVAVDNIIVVNSGMSVQGLVTVDRQDAPYRPLIAIAMNKPAGVLTATTDKRQSTVLDLLPATDRRRDPAPVGRLDKDTTGLLLITDDGQAAHALISPKSKVEKRYRALLDRPVEESDIEAFAQGIHLSDFQAMPAILEKGAGCMAYCTIHEGKFHQVKRMFAARGKTVLQLHREKMGNYVLPGELSPGEFIYLSLEEWNDIRAQAGLGPWQEE